MQRIVINSCFGGFSLSNKAIALLSERGQTMEYWDIPRDDPILVEVVEQLGEEANGRCAELKIVEVPDNVRWTIEAFDGMEHVAEVHRTWR